MHIQGLLKKYKSFILYVFFGVLTTAVNFIVYIALFHTGTSGNVPATIIAWICATVFAFVTNKMFVFCSNAKKPKDILTELVNFYLFRIGTGILDFIIMWVAVDILMLNASLFKLISNALVIILNYIASKLVIFQKP